MAEGTVISENRFECSMEAIDAVDLRWAGHGEETHRCFYIDDRTGEMECDDLGHPRIIPQSVYEEMRHTAWARLNKRLKKHDAERSFIDGKENPNYMPDLAIVTRVIAKAEELNLPVLVVLERLYRDTLKDFPWRRFRFLTLLRDHGVIPKRSW